MEQTNVIRQYASGEEETRREYWGPVQFTCDGDVRTLTASHSIWNPAKVFAIPQNYDNGRTIIELRTF